MGKYLGPIGQLKCDYCGEKISINKCQGCGNNISNNLSKPKIKTKEFKEDNIFYSSIYFVNIINLILFIYFILKIIL